MISADFLAWIDELLERDGLAWAFRTLCDLRDSVSRQTVATEAQVRAVRNIEAGGQSARGVETGLPSTQRADGFSARRYEGR